MICEDYLLSPCHHPAIFHQPERHSDVRAVDPGGVDQRVNVSLNLSVQLDANHMQADGGPISE